MKWNRFNMPPPRNENFLVAMKLNGIWQYSKYYVNGDELVACGTGIVLDTRGVYWAHLTPPDENWSRFDTPPTKGGSIIVSIKHVYMWSYNICYYVGGEIITVGSWVVIDPKDAYWIKPIPPEEI
jgi:hypothetical protein